MAEDNWWASSPFATAASAKAAAAPARVKPTSQDMQLLRDSTNKAEAERNARREYAAVRRSVTNMNTGPFKAAYLDAITPEESSGVVDNVLDKVGAAVGFLPSLFVSNRTTDARQHLKTVSAQTALKGSQMMKGASSDKDTALMRMAGVSDYKSVNENLRILREAERSSAIEQHRATLKAKWIGRYGSISAPAPSGMTYEEAAARQEALVNKAVDIRQNGLPKPPPKRSGSRPRPSSNQGQGSLEIDMNGRPLR